MLTEAIGAVLPAAVGVAISPIPIVAVILMLATPRARTNGPAFALGWMLGLVTVSVIVLFVASGADDPDSSTSTGVNWVQVGLGVLFVSMAMRQWRKRPRGGEAPAMPKWMTAVDHFTPVRSLVLGVGLSAVNPKNLALTLAAAASVAESGLTAADSTIAIAVFVMIGSLTVAGAVLFSLVAGERAEHALSGARQFMTQHNAAIMMVILLVLGAKLIGDGVGGL